MYGNPNKDQGNRQKIYERKQNRNETFLSFKMEIERLNKLLSSPLDPQRIFEVIWDNMRPHYRSKLACRTVRDIGKLEYYAYRIDANDAVFKQSREGTGRLNAVHNIEVDGKAENSNDSDSEPEEVNVVERKFDRERRPKESGAMKSNEDDTRNQRNPTGASQPPLCWNCRKNGHLWRNCPAEKKLFCYICGTQGKTVTTCKNHTRESGGRSTQDSEN